MSEYMFGVTKIKPSVAEAFRRNRAARKRGGYYVEVNRRENEAIGINGGRYQGWFAIPNRGAPFDQQAEQAILEEIKQ